MTETPAGIGSQELETALRLGAATLFEAAGTAGALPSRITPVSPGLPVSGRAFPVTLPPGDNLRLHHAIYAASPGDVIVATAAGGYEYGYFGEVLAEAALARGIAGLIIDGGVRDTRQTADLGFPVFSERRCIRGTGKNPALAGSLGKPVVIGGTTVHTGDLVVGDADGVVVVPAAEARQAIAAGIQRERKEAELIRLLREGKRSIDLYGMPAVEGAV